jgi:membrane-associated phospholipid phosphatase
LRPRPDLYAARELNIPMPELLPTQHSFPSGHTLLAAAIMMVLLYRYRDWRAWGSVVFVFLVGLARVYQGMHWPSDIVGSVILGVVAGILAVKVSDLPIVRQRTQDRVAKPKTAAVAVEAEKKKEIAGVR